MRLYLVAVLCFIYLFASAKEVTDTVFTRDNDKIIISYNVTSNDDRVVLKFDRAPRIIPSKSSILTKACKGEPERLKIVVFDRIGDVGETRWSGILATAFMVPVELSYDLSSDGYYILGQSQPMEFYRHGNRDFDIKLPIYIAIYEKKQNYKVVSSSMTPLSISSAILGSNNVARKESSRIGGNTQTIAITSSEEIESDNGDLIRVLSNIELVNELLAQETEYPFSTNMQMEMSNLRSMRNEIKDPDIIEKINRTLKQCADKERDLKEAQGKAALAAKAQEQALIQQQKQEADAQQKEAEEKARIQEEKQQKRTLWMIIGGAILAVVGFIGNAIFKHFRDIRNQQSIMQMQESLARQAEHEAGRRSREIVRNKAHQLANKGRNKMRDSLNGAANKPNKNKRRSI